jgi:hypothetical protein
VRAKERNAALLAAYTPKPGKPFTEATEPVIMIDPPSLNSGNAFWTVNSVPRAFRPKPHRSAIDSDSIRDFLLEPAAAAAIVLLTDISDARSISRLLRSGVRAILSRESETDDVLSAFYAAAAVRGSEVWLLADDGLAGSCCSAAFGLCSDAASPCDAAR